MYFCKPLKLLKHITDNCIVNGSIALFVFSIALSLLNGAHANPSLNTVLKGSAQVSSTATTTTITQTSQSTTLNWNSFDVSQNQRVTFNQPSSSSIAINNILDTSPSQIFGSITANGRIVLLNPNGFYFGARSSVSANTFIAAATTLANSSYNPSTNSLSLVNRHDVVSDIQVLGSIHAQKVQLFAQTIEVSGTISSNQQGFISIRSNQDIRITGSISSHNGTIDIFALDGTASTSGTISTATGINDEAVEGFVEFSGSVIDIQPTAVFDLNPQDTLLFDPEYIVIVGGAIPTPCPPASSGIMDCGFTMGTELSGGTATVSAIYENTLEGITAGTIRLQADFGIQFLGTFTSGLTLAPNVSLELETTVVNSNQQSLPTVRIDETVDLGNNIVISQSIETSGTGTITINSISNILFDEPTPDSDDSIFLTTGGGDISLTAVNGSIVRSRSAPVVTIDVNQGVLRLIASEGSVGSPSSAIIIDRSSGDWTNTNLYITTATNGLIYLQTNDSGVLDATINNFGSDLNPSTRTGTFSLVQTAGDIIINRHLNIPEATIILAITSAGGGSILRSGAQTTDVTANLLTLSAFGGNIGADTNPLVLSRNTDADDRWTSSSLVLTTRREQAATDTAEAIPPGFVYVTHPESATLTSYLRGVVTTNNFIVAVESGDIIVDSEVTIHNNADYTLSLISTSGNILSRGGTINVPNNSNFVLNFEADGSIGTEANPFTLERRGTIWSSSTLSLTSGLGNDIHLTHTSSATLLSIALSSITTNTLHLSLNRGDIDIRSNISVDYGLSLIARSGLIVGVRSASITAPTLMLSARGSIGSNANPLLLTRSSGSWGEESLILMTNSNSSIYLTHTTLNLLQSYSLGSITTGTLSLALSNNPFLITNSFVNSFAANNMQYSLLRLVATNNSLSLTESVIVNRSLELQGHSITTTNSENKLTLSGRPNLPLRLSLISLRGDIGDSINRFYISSGENENPNFASLRIQTPFGSTAHIRRDVGAPTVITGNTTAFTFLLYDHETEPAIGRFNIRIPFGDNSNFQFLQDLFGDTFTPIFESLSFIYDIFEPVTGSIVESLLELLGSGCDVSDYLYAQFGGFACSDYDANLAN